MKYTVTLKLWFPDGTIRWAVRCYPEASNESDALLFVKLQMVKNDEFKDCKIIEARIKGFEEKDLYTFCIDTDRWDSEEKNKTAPAEIARALNRIADNMRDLKQSPVSVVQEKGIDPFAFAALIFSSISVITSVILILLFRQ